MTIDELLTLPARIEALELSLPPRVRALEAALARRETSQQVREQQTAVRLWTPALTERETGLLAYLAAGWTNQEIADHLGLSERTVRTHVTNILSKLSTTNRTTVALWAMGTGGVQLSEAIRLMAQRQPHLIADAGEGGGADVGTH